MSKFMIGLIAAMILAQAPAFAGNIEVWNKTNTVIVADVTYFSHLCRDDKNQWIAIGARWHTGAGACKVKTVNAVMKNKQGKTSFVCSGYNATNMALPTKFDDTIFTVLEHWKYSGDHDDPNAGLSKELVGCTISGRH